jgi:hypothetical protein
MQRKKNKIKRNNVSEKRMGKCEKIANQHQHVTFCNEKCQSENSLRKQKLANKTI